MGGAVAALVYLVAGAVLFVLSALGRFESAATFR
jgi:hypothetical protein